MLATVIDNNGIIRYHTAMTPAALLSSLRPALKHRHMKVRHLAVLLLLAEAPSRVDFTAGAWDLRLPKSAMTRSCDVLYKLGFIDREYSQDDARKIFLGMTPKGREFIRSMGVSS